ncbi:hypothetical protein AMTRI_Chr11g100860 [Amborella trichopoda]
MQQTCHCHSNRPPKPLFKNHIKPLRNHQTQLLHKHIFTSNHIPRPIKVPPMKTTLITYCSKKPNLLLEKPLVHKQPRVTNKVPRERKPLHCKTNGDPTVESVSHEDKHLLMLLLGLSYWVQGFRCLPWMGVNFYMKDNMKIDSQTLQLMHNIGNLPMVAKPIFGIFSDVVYVGDEHRLPYISIGVVLQALSWGGMALIPSSSKYLPAMMACLLLSNLGASITEVIADTILTEFAKKVSPGSINIHSYAWMVLLTGGILGNVFAGFILKHHHPKITFLIFSLLLFPQLLISLVTKEHVLDQTNSKGTEYPKKIKKVIEENLTTAIKAISELRIFRLIIWVLASTAMVPTLSSALFYYYTQHLKIKPSVIGASKVLGMVGVLIGSFLYGRFFSNISLDVYSRGIQFLYAIVIFSNLLLINRANLAMGISDEACMLCVAVVAEVVGQMRMLPFMATVALGSPAGYEGSVPAVFAAGMCLSNIISELVGASLSSFLHISHGNFEGLHSGILVQFFAALVPLALVPRLPSSKPQG